ncbi:hypothetical protein MWU75_12235 [Ornithinimicrobium sp. F0845]|uniref:hypothetical protein n=1 Tax=Ornithinimicrobium sp. F0845 TaxID=2926412 RepID=UPI001FF62A05|nr:hypothetical protein [Ornithinimicrobium sp. F0845]
MMVEGFSEDGAAVRLPVPELLSELSGGAHEVFDEAVDGGEWLTDSDLVGQIRGLQIMAGSAQAAQVVRIAQFAARTLVDTDTGLQRVDRGVGFVDEFASDTLAPLLGMSHGPAATRVRTSAKLAADLPRTLAALAAGDLDLFRAQVIAESWPRPVMTSARRWRRRSTRGRTRRRPAGSVRASARSSPTSILTPCGSARPGRALSGS